MGIVPGRVKGGQVRASGGGGRLDQMSGQKS